MSVLLLDIGNSRIKAARWSGRDGDALESLPVLAHAGDAASAVAVIDTAAGAPPQAVWISSVLGADAEALLAAAVQSRWKLPVRFARAEGERLGLVSAYREPARLGIDRWLAMLGAWTQAHRAALVVDAGTALTADGIDAGGRHLGGFIAPGLATAERAVLGATRFAKREHPAGYGAGFGRDTETCVRQGALLACIGAIERAASLVDSGAVKLITGGDAEVLRCHLSGDWQHRPLLVLEGLRALAAGFSACGSGDRHDLGRAARPRGF